MTATSECSVVIEAATGRPLEVRLNGLRMAPEFIDAMFSAEWDGPFWVRRNGDTALITRLDPTLKLPQAAAPVEQPESPEPTPTEELSA